MLPISQIPSKVEQMFSGYPDCGESEEQYVHFLRYETGLLIPRPMKATLDGINTLFCGSLKRSQSSFNRVMLRSPWETKKVDARRIELLKKHPILKPGKKGVIAIDAVLLEKTGKHIDGVD